MAQNDPDAVADDRRDAWARLGAARTRADYAARISRALALLHRAALDAKAGDPDLDTLADAACFSRYHFHRIFRAMTGETPADALRSLRLHRAAALLIETDAPIAEIAAQAGYGGVVAFTRAFRARYRTPPAAFRAAGQQRDAAGSSRPLERGQTMTDPTANDPLGQPFDMANVRIEDRSAQTVLALEHRGPYPEIGAAFTRLAVLLNGHGVSFDGAQMIGVYFNDPDSTPASELRSLAAIALPAATLAGPAAPAIAAEADVAFHDLPGGPHAMYEHTGPYASLPMAWRELYGRWLPESGREPADAPSFEVYLNDPRAVAPADLRTRLAIPLAPA